MTNRWRTAAGTGSLLLAALAAPALSNDLPSAVRTESAVTATNKGLIEKYVKDQLTRMADPATAGVARDEITRQAEQTPTVTPSSSFLTTYTDAVAANIGPMIDPTAEVNKRLNGAIVTAKLSRSTPNRSLLPVAQKVMKDESAAVAMWGLKAGAAHLEQTLTVPLWFKGQTLTASIVEGGKRHLEAGPVVQTAYDSLYLTGTKLPGDAYKTCVTAMNELLVARTALYKAGVPASPQADQVAMTFFAVQDVRPVILSDPKLRVDTVQNCLNLIKAAADRVPSASQGEAQTQVMAVLTRTSSAMAVLFNQQPAVSALFQRIASQKLPLNANVQQDIAAAADAVSKLAEFKTVKAP